jgi:hypothetical protein
MDLIAKGTENTVDVDEVIDLHKRESIFTGRDWSSMLFPRLMTTSAQVDPRRCGSSDVPSRPKASP